MPGDQSTPGLELSVEADDWLIASKSSNSPIQARATGKSSIGFDQKKGGWASSGEFSLAALNIGKSIHVQSATTAWTYEPVNVEGDATTDHAGSFKAQIPSLGEGVMPEGPVELSVDVAYEPKAARLVAKEGKLSGGGQTIELRGQATELNTAAPLIEFSGQSPLSGELLEGLISQAIGIELLLDGEQLDVQVSGRLDSDALADPLDKLNIAARLSAQSADAVGLHVGPMALTARTENGKFEIAPIDTTLNNGHVRVLPEVTRGADGVLVLKLGEGSMIEGAEINEQLSTELLSFAVPVLERATHPTGRVSASVRHAEIPIGPGSEGRSPDVEAQLVFDTVEFGPGPLAYSILSLLKLENATLRLNQPILATIEDRRVRTTGFAIPIANVTQFEIEGSVGFDRSLDLVARLPLTRQLLGDVPVVSEIFGGLSIDVPIGGDLGKPKLDGIAFNHEVQSMAGELAKRGLSGGVNGVLNLLERIRDRRMQRRQMLRPPGPFNQP
jgi:hypothetical protein